MTTADKRIAGLFQLGKSAPPPECLHYPIFASAKLNGIRAMYIPAGCYGVRHTGMYSRRGVMYECLSHIKIDYDRPLDGEMYAHGHTLQQIQASCSPNLQIPTELTKQLQFCVFDVLRPATKLTRVAELEGLIRRWTNVNIIRHKLIGSPRELVDYYEHVVGLGFEGLMLQYPKTHYTAGRSNAIMKVKAWKFMVAEFVDVTAGDKKYTGYAGAMVCMDQDKRKFLVGTGFDDEFRFGKWRDHIGAKCLIQYLNLSEDGVPLNASFIEFS